MAALGIASLSDCTNSPPLLASRTAAVASTSNGSAPIPRTTASNRAITPIAWPTPSSFSRPVVSRPRPSRSTDFSLKMVTGLREMPSNTTSRTELEPRSTTAVRERGLDRVMLAQSSRMRSGRRGNGCDTGVSCGRAADPRPESDGLVMK